jgi:hypothetical protein
MKTRIVLLGLLLLLSSAAFGADVSGVWQVTISSTGPDGTTNQDKGMASLKQTGETITGWVGPDESRQTPVEGTIKENRVILKASPRPERNMTFELTLSGEKLAGTVHLQDLTRTGDDRKGTAEFVKAPK